MVGLWIILSSFERNTLKYLCWFVFFQELIVKFLVFEQDRPHVSYVMYGNT